MPTNNVLRSRQLNPCDSLYWKCRGYPERPVNWKEILQDPRYLKGNVPAYVEDEDCDTEEDYDEEDEDMVDDEHSGDEDDDTGDNSEEEDAEMDEGQYSEDESDLEDMEDADSEDADYSDDYSDGPNNNEGMEGDNSDGTEEDSEGMDEESEDTDEYSDDLDENSKNTAIPYYDISSSDDDIIPFHMNRNIQQKKTVNNSKPNI